jgi:hypothetical protein
MPGENDDPTPPGPATPPPIVRWNRRHAAQAGRAEASDSAPADASPIADWSRRHAAAARVDRARRNGTSASANTAAITNSVPLRQQPARPATPRAEATPVTGSAQHPEPPTARSALQSLARLLMLLGWLLALLIVLDVAFVVLHANPTNGWAAAVLSWAPHLDLGLAELALTRSPTANMWINHGLAAVSWVVAGTVLGLIIRRLATRVGR